ncbi:hypothetical protein [Micromonospora sp. CA-246542]|uniref:hypothetical protein n=1 Tax=Micromonospora sp. CA-246542 TaxID=3239959 RepID=UPI003D8C97F3
MNIKPYRTALALPGLRSLLLVAVLARIPLTATGVTLTFHVVLDLDRGYGAAGLRADHRGLRRRRQPARPGRGTR